MRLRSLLLIAPLLALGLTACEDPSNVGLDLVGGEGGAPVVVTLDATAFEPAPLVDPSPDTSRTVLAGYVDDPIFSTLSATGHLDFSTPVLSDGFEAGPVTSARLRLWPSYRYGDTTSVVTYRLHSVPSTWSFTSAPPDTTLPAGDPIVEFSFTASDTLVEIDLPMDWVQENDALMRGSTFNSGFHGFQIAPVSGNAVVGFDRGRSFLRAFTASDSATFVPTKGFSALRRVGTPARPADRLLLQDGTGPGIRLSFDFTEDSLGQGGLNRAAVRVYADTSLFQTGTSFVRPILRLMRLYAIDANGNAAHVANAALDSTGTFTFQSSSANFLLSDLQSVLLGNLTIDYFELRPPAGSHTLNPIALYAATVPERGPRALLTVTRVQ